MLGRRRYAIGCVAFAVLISGLRLWAAGADHTSKIDDLTTLTAAAISADPQAATHAIGQLRERGPAGLDALMNAYRNDIDAHRLNPTVVADPQRWGRISAAVDAVAKQRDAWSSGLYWYTDLAAAQAAAKASGKPILSLHLLGQLDQELSCANSRFFRVTLYANRDVQAAMRKCFILHWKSERPVPTITIDFGDGRKMVRTITGNSIHYVLDADGYVIDAIPGLYGAQPFVRRVYEAAQFESNLREIHSPLERVIALHEWHRHQINAVEAECNADLTALHLVATPSTDDFDGWRKLGELHASEMQVDQGVKMVMTAKNPDAMRAGNLAISKRLAETPLVKAVRNIQTSIAQDCMRNEYLLHRQIHVWLADGAVNHELNAFNNMVYTSLFLTPPSDPWLGLAPPDAYSALDDDGLVQSVAAKP